MSEKPITVVVIRQLERHEPVIAFVHTTPSLAGQFSDYELTSIYVDKVKTQMKADIREMCDQVPELREAEWFVNILDQNRRIGRASISCCEDL